MGKVASDFAERIILTNDNPRFENPQKIRRDIKKGIKKKRITEIANRAIAIKQAIHNLNSGDILLVAGKGHEKTQDIGNKKIFFSDRKVILNAIKHKNNNLSDNLKLNVVKEAAKIKNLSDSISLKTARIISK